MARIRLLAAVLSTAAYVVALPAPASAELPSGSIAVPESGTFLYFNSQAGDYIGGGVEHLYTAADTTFSAGFSGDRRSFNAWVVQGAFTHWWNVDLAAPEGQRLAEGAYEGAMRWPFQGPDSPGLSVWGDGRGCNTLTGRFAVSELSFAPTGELLVLEADFEQHCEGNPAALFGRIRIENPPPPPDVTPPTLVLPTDITTESPFGNPIAIGYSASAYDDRDPAPSLACEPPTGALFSVGTTEVTCVASDGAGNEARGSFRIVVLPPLQLALALAATGSLDARTGLATVSGTLECSRPLPVWVSGSVTQLFARRVTIGGSFSVLVDCASPSTPWTAAVQGDNGRFGAGAARVSVNASGCELSCHERLVSQELRLRGGG